jgi:hypothetical protein
MSQHQILATIGVGDPDIGAEVEVMVTFEYTAGSRDYWNKAGGHWEQGWGPEVSFVKAEPYCNGKPSPYYGAFADMEQDSLNQTVEFWLDDKGYQECCEEAERALEGPDPDDARQARIDDEMENRK